MTIAKKIATNNTTVDTANNTVISMTQYKDLLAWAEKVSNGQLDAATQIKTHCATWLNADIDKATVIDIIKADDLNGFRNFLAQFNFAVKDDAGYIHKLYTYENGDCVLAEIPSSESATTKFEAGKTYFEFWYEDTGLKHKQVYTVEKRTDKTITVGGKRYKIFLSDYGDGEYARVSYTKRVYAKNIYTELEVDTATKENNANELPTGKITVKSGTEAWAIVGKHFPKGNLEFYRAGKGFNNEDTFCYTLDEIIYVHVTCTPDNSRVECIEVINTYESGSKRHVLTVYINPDAAPESAMEDARAKFVAGQIYRNMDWSTFGPADKVYKIAKRTAKYVYIATYSEYYGKWVGGDDKELDRYYIRENNEGEYVNYWDGNRICAQFNDEEISKSERRDKTADSLTRAMTIALEHYQDFCRAKNLTGAEYELKLYNICRKAMTELWKEKAA